VSQISVGSAPPPSKKEPQSSTSAFGGDERHFNLAVINGEDTEVKKPVNGNNVEEELDPRFGKATLSKSAPVADIVVGCSEIHFIPILNDLIFLQLEQ
jgi:hypothetical protein